VQHLAVNETQSAKKMLISSWLLMTRVKMVLMRWSCSRFGELSDELLGNPLAAMRRVDPDYLNRRSGAG
jgi:hypothetical protein